MTQAKPFKAVPVQGMDIEQMIREDETQAYSLWFSKEEVLTERAEHQKEIGYFKKEMLNAAMLIKNEVERAEEAEKKLAEERKYCLVFERTWGTS